MESVVKKWLSYGDASANRLKELEKTLSLRKEDQQNILLERIRDPDRADVYTEMLEKCEDDIKRLSSEVESIKNSDETIKKRRERLREGIGIIDGVLSDGDVSNAGLRMLVEKISVSEQNEKLSLAIMLKGSFRHHLDIIENGEITERFFETSLEQTDEGDPAGWIPCEDTPENALF